jgi:hypothetical protein
MTPDERNASPTLPKRTMNAAIKMKWLWIWVTLEQRRMWSTYCC